MRKKHRSQNVVVRFAFGIILIFLIFSVINMQYELKELNERKLEVQEQIKDVEDNIQEIKIRLDAPRTDEYIERVAREKLGYRKPNEIIFFNNIAN